MANEFKSEDIEQAILALLSSIFNFSVEKIASTDFDADGNLISPMPALRLLYEGSTDTPLQGISRRDYEVEHQWTVFCAARNLRSKGDEDTDAKKLISNVRAALAGVRLALPDGTQAEPIALAGAERYQFDAKGCVYAQRIAVTDVAQFPGGAQ